MNDDFVLESYGAEDTLDLFSTSPTLLRTCADFLSERCIYHAPFFACKVGGSRWSVIQGCCNHWDCPRCGRMVASQHYGRIVEGTRQLAETSDIWFITITCRGADLSRDDAVSHYLQWTNRLLDACRAKAKRAGEEWHYVQVTELQKRGHPHSHILTTFCPHDVYLGHTTKWEVGADKQRRANRILSLRSDWLQERVLSAGLGEQYDLSKVETVEGASRYVAKYMFKEAQFQNHYPKGWKRVRYSQSFPKLKREKSDAFVLLSRDDWRHLASLAVVVDAEQGEAFETAQYFLQGNDTIIHERKIQHERHDRK